MFDVQLRPVGTHFLVAKRSCTKCREPVTKGNCEF